MLSRKQGKKSEKYDNAMLIRRPVVSFKVQRAILMVSIKLDFYRSNKLTRESTTIEGISEFFDQRKGMNKAIV